MTEKITNNLKKYFGFDSFRKGQREIIEKILEGRDVLGVLPTGGGKSICYQLPALMKDGLTLVISPLINLANNLNLKRVSAPLFVSKKSGLNDNLNGVEKPVSFNLPEADNEEMEIVHSLAKWKRYALMEYKFKVHEGR